MAEQGANYWQVGEQPCVFDKENLQLGVGKIPGSTGTPSATTRREADGSAGREDAGLPQPRRHGQQRARQHLQAEASVLMEMGLKATMWVRGKM